MFANVESTFNMLVKTPLNVTISLEFDFTGDLPKNKSRPSENQNICPAIYNPYPALASASAPLCSPQRLREMKLDFETDYQRLRK